MPNGIQWNNYADCLYRLHAAYCAKEGLSRSSDLAKSVMYFMFYGNYRWATKDSEKRPVTRVKPFIIFLHKKMVGARSRFAQKVPLNFNKFIKLFREDEEFYQPFLMDKGNGDPPLKYLITFEEGLRNYASCVHSLGTRPLRSRTSWANVAKWRKREAYIALCRYLISADTGYRQWDCFRFDDYTMRQTMGLTFDVRHYPLSNGQDEKNFGEGSFKFDWKKHHYSPPKRVKSEIGEYQSSELTQQPSTPSKDDVPMIYDVELGKLVPLD